MCPPVLNCFRFTRRFRFEKRRLFALTTEIGFELQNALNNDLSRPFTELFIRRIRNLGAIGPRAAAAAS
jgi:hypothetical protein